MALTALALCSILRAPSASHTDTVIGGTGEYFSRHQAIRTKTNRKASREIKADVTSGDADSRPASRPANQGGQIAQLRCDQLAAWTGRGELSTTPR